MSVVLFIILFLLGAFFSAVETAFFSLQVSKIRLMKKQNTWNAHLIERLKKNPEQLLITILVGSTVVNLSTGSYATFLATDQFGSLGLGIITGIMTLVVLLVGEIIPKSIAYADNVKVAQYTAYPLYFFWIVFYPIAKILNILNTKLNSYFSSNNISHVTEEEVLIMSRMSVEKGGIDYDQHTLIERVFQFDDITVGFAMTPFPRIEFIDGDVPVDNIAYHVSQTGHSRYPVFLGTNHNIIGYIHVNRVMRILNSDERDKPVRDFIIPIQRIDEHVSLERAFRSMNKRHAHMQLVHAHKDKTKIIGLITLEDILEQLVGEIEDETDL